MPRRNLLVLLSATLVALLCHQRVQKNIYGRVLTNAMARIENRYLEPVRASQLFEGAMEGMLGNLDDYSAYVSPADLERFHETIDREFGGIGVEVAIDPQTRQLMVLCPLLGSPAQKAGVRAGDKILRIRQSSTQGMSLNDAASLLRGKPGEAVTLTILHENEEEPVEVTIVREVVQADTVRGDTRNADGSWNFFLQQHERIGYVRIGSFTENTAGELLRALEWLRGHDVRGLVLDLRDNPGGYLKAAIDVCDMLIPAGVIVTIRGREGRINRAYAADGKGQFTALSVAALINQYSASAAEIVAACLQDHRRAPVIGQRSFGKGTIQEIIDLEEGCGAMKLTSASYWRPSGKNIARRHNAGPKDAWGVTPDEGYEVVVEGDELTGWRLWRSRRDVFQTAADGGPPSSDQQAFTDRPLVKAVEYLEKEAGAAQPAVGSVQ